MTFAAAAAAGAIVAAHARDPSGFADSTTYTYARQIVAQIFSVYALRMAAVFQISQATLWLRTGVMPRWMALITYPVALVLLFVFTHSQLVDPRLPGMGPDGQRVHPRREPPQEGGALMRIVVHGQQAFGKAVLARGDEIHDRVRRCDPAPGACGHRLAAGSGLGDRTQVSPEITLSVLSGRPSGGPIGLLVRPRAVAIDGHDVCRRPDARRLARRRHVPRW